MGDSRDTHSGDSRDPPCSALPGPGHVVAPGRLGPPRPPGLPDPRPAAGGGRQVIDNDTVATTARQLRLILDAIERGDLDASATVRARLEGAATALEALAARNP